MPDFISPSSILNELPGTLPPARISFSNILNGTDPRFVIILGPCSIDDPKAALDYAHRLSQLQKEVESHFLLLMRVYLEKPRTSHGWSGFLNEPNRQFNPEEGIRLGRKLLLEIGSLGIPIATEFLSPFTAPYLQDLITWGSIGARTSTSVLHRQLASQLPMPVGFKNSLDGCIPSAINGIKMASLPQTSFGLNPDGHISLITSKGNPDCHLVLRGGTFTGPNYDIPSIKNALQLLEDANLPQKILIDCSHQNSGKNPKRQIEVFKKVMRYREKGIKSIFGCMLESYIQGGSQKTPIHYGQSLTDPCISWEETYKLVTEFAQCYV